MRINVALESIQSSVHLFMAVCVYSAHTHGTPCGEEAVFVVVGLTKRRTSASLEAYI